MTRFGFLPKFNIHKINTGKRFPQNFLIQTYQESSSASVDDLWGKITNLADMSWHPLLASTNVPNGLVVKPGLIYQAVTRMVPIPLQIFVERVSPKESFSIRILVMPGLEEKVTYQVRSTLCGTCVSYSVTLRGWLSPLAWSFLRPCAARVALNLVRSVEQAALQAVSGEFKPSKRDCLDF